jgi:hypothetical protein
MNKSTSRGIVGLFRASCDALEAALRGVDGGIAFNGYSWVGGSMPEVQDVDVCVVRLVKTGDGRITGTISDVLSHDEATEIRQQLNGHAGTHGVDLSF